MDNVESNDSSNVSFSPAMVKYRDSLQSAIRVCKRNFIFNFAEFLSSKSRSEPCMMGIDEAGRGPVLGPMVYACAVSSVKYLPNLKKLGLADSKKLSESQREDLLCEMFNRSDSISGFVHIISPRYISEKMLDKIKTNLNTISHDAAIGLINSVLNEGINLKEVYVDTVGKAEIYQAKLQKLFPNLKICVESKADDTYPIVSAASIFAKVTRDRILRMWPRSEAGLTGDDTEFGSGYPGDPVTKKYIRSSIDPVFGFPALVRSSWSTASVLLDEFALPIVWEDDQTEDEMNEAKKLARKRGLATGTSKLSNFFQTQSKSVDDLAKRQAYFVRTGLVHVTKLL